MEQVALGLRRVALVDFSKLSVSECMLTGVAAERRAEQLSGSASANGWAAVGRFACYDGLFSKSRFREDARDEYATRRVSAHPNKQQLCSFLT